MKRIPSLLLLVSALSCVATVASTAFAEPSDEDIAKAKKRFEEGKSFEDAEKWSDALAAFNDVATVKMTPQVRFQIAFCEENLGHVVAAAHGYEDALALARKDDDRAKEVLKAAPERLTALRPRIPHVLLDISGPGAGKTKFTVLIDDAPVAENALHMPVDLETGAHAVDLETESHDGKKKQHVADITLAERQEKHVAIEVPLVDSTDAGSEPVPTPVPEKAGDKTPAIVVGTIGIASLIGSAVFLGLRQDTISRVSATCKSADMLSRCSPKLASVAEDGRTDTYTSAALGVVGALALGTSVALWFTVGKSSHSNQASTTLFVSPTRVGLATRF